jgi:hypothetical protein
VNQDPILRRMHACVLALVPCILWSPPGAGKTARVFSYAKARSKHCERWLLSRCEPIDIKPRIYHEGRIIVSDPPEIERLRARGGLLFADELNRATREVEGATLDLVDNPPQGVAVIAACNPPSRGQAARALESAAANRFCHLHVEVDAEAWANAQVGGWPNDAGDFTEPDDATLAKATATASALVGAFIRRTGGATLECAPDDPASAGKPWPSARTWDYVKRLHAVALALDLPPDDVLALVSGCVGPGPATQYLAFVADADLPDPEALLAKPDAFVPDPSRVDRTVVAMTAVVGAVDRDFTDARWKAAWELIAVCAADGQKDVAPAIVAGYMLVAAFERFKVRDAVKAKTITPAFRLMPVRVALVMTPPKGP